MKEYFSLNILEQPREKWPIGERLILQHMIKNRIPVSYFKSETIRMRERRLPLEAIEWVS